MYRYSVSKADTSDPLIYHTVPMSYSPGPSMNGLYQPHVLRLVALAVCTRYGVKFKPLTFGHALYAERAQRRSMEEHVLATGVRSDETESLGGIKKLDRAEH
jgi:hypothetical protein